MTLSHILTWSSNVKTLVGELKFDNYSRGTLEDAESARLLSTNTEP